MSYDLYDMMFRNITASNPKHILTAPVLVYLWAHKPINNKPVLVSYMGSQETTGTYLYVWSHFYTSFYFIFNLILAIRINTHISVGLHFFVRCLGTKYLLIQE